uniref:Zinc finger MYM-type protein 1-like n=1 Tax=Nicotiana sylvestris TaxID=4096 RepID=A0A1U7VNJ3_NICSY|nr:PREDICTED: zinc finger MYM-type protein 1-like [Nicotiana sylvestris]
MAIVLRYVDRRGSVMECFMGIVHVRDTTALSLRNEIVSLLTKHSLSPSSIRGQCYDGASNIQGDLNGLKILMQKESRGAHSIHCFAHQLQLTLVAVSRRCDEVQELLLLVSDILNMVGASFKRRDELRESQAEEIEEALRKGELETGKGLNQELGLARAELLIGNFKNSSRFDEVTTDLLLGVACLNPVDSFSTFDIEKILRLAELYPDDFDKYSMVDLRFQLQNYIVGV